MYFPRTRRHVDPELAEEFRDEIGFLQSLSTSPHPPNKTEYDGIGKVENDPTRTTPKRKVDYKKS